TMRENPELDVESAITELGVGEALISLLDEKGRPTVTERAWMVAPGSRIGPATEQERQAIRNASLVGGKYERVVDRESAYERLAQRAETAPAQVDTQNAGAPPSEDGGMMGAVSDFLFGSTGPRGGRRDGV